MGLIFILTGGVAFHVAVDDELDLATVSNVADFCFDAFGFVDIHEDCSRGLVVFPPADLVAFYVGIELVVFLSHVTLHVPLGIGFVFQIFGPVETAVRVHPFGLVVHHVVRQELLDTVGVFKPLVGCNLDGLAFGVGNVEAGTELGLDGAQGIDDFLGVGGAQVGFFSVTLYKRHSFLLLKEPEYLA